MAKRLKQRKRRECKDDSIEIRVSGEDKEIIREAAKRVGLGLSSWMLMISLERAKISLKRVKAET